MKTLLLALAAIALLSTTAPSFADGNPLPRKPGGAVTDGNPLPRKPAISVTDGNPLPRKPASPLVAYNV